MAKNKETQFALINFFIVHFYIISIKLKYKNMKYKKHEINLSLIFQMDLLHFHVNRLVLLHNTNWAFIGRGKDRRRL